jgi:nucleotide-binding universal stress UspA family protein
LRQGDRPVLVVKRAPRKPYRRVLVAVDFSMSSYHALEFALRLAPSAQFHILHTYQGSEGLLERAGFTQDEILQRRRQMAKETRKAMGDFLRRLKAGGRRPKCLLGYGRAPHVIVAFAKRLRADLVCVGTMGRTGLPYILLGSVAEHVIREAPCDVLAVRVGAPKFRLP